MRFLLPCQSPSCAGKGAMLPASLAYPAGEPALVGRYTPEMTCARCKRRNVYEPADFARLPPLQLEEYEQLAKVYQAPEVANVPTRDLEGAGFPKQQARDLFRAGRHDVHELEKLDRNAPPDPPPPPPPAPPKGPPKKGRKKGS